MTASTTVKRDLSLYQMTGPLVVSFVMRAAFTFVDTIYAASIGDAAVAAIGLTVPFEFMMIAIWVGLSTGLTAALSRTMSSGEGKKIEQYLRAAWTMAWIISPLFLILGLWIWFFAPQYNLRDDVYQAFRIYAGVLLGGSAFTAFWSVMPDSIVKAHQDTRSTMWAGICSNVINVTLNTLFLFVFHWGIFGIALSTVIGRIGGLVYALRKARQHEQRRLAEDTHNVPGLDPHPYRTQLSLAVPAGLTFVLTSAEMAILNFLLAGLPNPTEAIAAYSIYHRVALFAMNPLIAMSVAMLPFAGRLVGKKDWEGLHAGIGQALRAATGYSLLFVGPIMVLIGPWLARSLAESPLTAEYTRFALYAVPLACLFSTPFFLVRPVFEAFGQGRPGLLLSIARTIAALPVAWVSIAASMRLGYAGLYGLVIGLLLVAAISSAGFVVWLRSAMAKFIAEHDSTGRHAQQPGAPPMAPELPSQSAD